MITYDRLWETLKAKNLSVNQLNKQLGVSKGQISRLKNNMNVSTNTLNRLCALLHCDLPDIMEYHYDPSDLSNIQRKKIHSNHNTKIASKDCVLPKLALFCFSSHILRRI